MKINLLYAYHAGANCKYFETTLSFLEDEKDFSYKIVRPNEFKSIDLKPYNALVYQTFPDYNNIKKFHLPAIQELDKIFLKFKGLKILLDSFDMGGNNAYKRFGMKYPRIKHTPSLEYLKIFDVISILITTGWSHEKYFNEALNVSRDTAIHCAFTLGVYPHNKREKIISILRQDKYKDITSFERIPMEEYDSFLRTVRVSVVSGGFGETSGSIYPALKAGALLFVHEDVRKIKSFPYSDLVDGEDYVSFNLKNFSKKLDWILEDKEAWYRIRKSGQRKFYKGFDPERSAKDFLEYLKKECK